MSSTLKMPPWIGSHLRGVDKAKQYSSSLSPSTTGFTDPDLDATPNLRLFALLIGIDKYKDTSITKLRGAVADCADIAAFLKDEICAQVDIKCLYNDQATREDIFTAITNLASDGRIEQGDPILIYYAGHGAEALPPPEWREISEGKIQMILPYDFIRDPGAHNQGAQAAESRDGQGIFDRTLSGLLAQLYGKKGDNIVVILDSCHSGSGTRLDEANPTSLSRGVELPQGYAISASLHKSDFHLNTNGSRGSSVPSTHVLLAACREDQTAKESHGRGLFTSALTEVLRRDGFNKMSYKELILRLPAIGREQDPQCEGTHENQIFFKSLPPRKKPVLYGIEVRPENSESYLLNAGDAHGITSGAEFAVISKHRVDSSPSGVLLAYKVLPFTSILHHRANEKFEIPEPAVAFEIHKGNQEAVRVAVDAGLKDELLKEAVAPGVMLVGELDDADLRLILDASSNTSGFQILQKACVDHGLTHTYTRPGSSIPDAVRLLSHAAHFYFHLHRSNKSGKHPLASKIKVELVPVHQTGDRLINEYVADQDEHGQDVNLNINGLATTSVGDESVYGINIKNVSYDTPLYASLFYFNQSDLSIECFHKPATAVGGNSPACLPAGNSLKIGYGIPGGRPLEFRFTLRGQKVDVGFLKLFLSTVYVDLSNIGQGSLVTVSRGMAWASVVQEESWDSVMLTVVQHRK